MTTETPADEKYICARCGEESANFYLARDHKCDSTPASDIERRAERDELFALIEHGDADHRVWLHKELTKFFSSRHSAAKEEVEKRVKESAANYADRNHGGNDYQQKVQAFEAGAEWSIEAEKLRDKLTALEAENAELKQTLDHNHSIALSYRDQILGFDAENARITQNNSGLIVQNRELIFELDALKTVQKELIEALEDFVCLADNHNDEMFWKLLEKTRLKSIELLTKLSKDR